MSEFSPVGGNEGYEDCEDEEERFVFKNIVLALERIERRQRLILEQLKAMETGENRGPRKAGRLCGERTSGEVSEPCCMQRGEGYKAREDAAWLESGIDNILAYQVGKKRGEQ